MKAKTNHDNYAARIGEQYICAGSARGNLVTSAQTKDAKKFPDYVTARTYAIAMGGDNTVSPDRHGMVGVVDSWE